MRLAQSITPSPEELQVMMAKRNSQVPYRRPIGPL